MNNAVIMKYVMGLVCIWIIFRLIIGLNMTHSTNYTAPKTNLSINKSKPLGLFESSLPAGTMTYSEAVEAEEKNQIGRQSFDKKSFWVTSEQLNRRTCPSIKCGIVGRIFFRQGVTVFEKKNGWARITKPYNAACENNRSVYIDEGNNECVSQNGILNGNFSEWVSFANLSQTRPPDPAKEAKGDEKLVAKSNDFKRYKTVFTQAARSLILSKHCTEKNFRQMGGWWKSVQYRNDPVYFTYCGNSTSEYKIYLNAETREIFQ